MAKCIMGVQITIRDVPEDRAYSSRAARARKSMQEYLKEELERLAARPSINTWLERVRERKQLAGRRVPPAKILQQRDADRR